MLWRWIGVIGISVVCILIYLIHLQSAKVLRLRDTPTTISIIHLEEIVKDKSFRYPDSLNEQPQLPLNPVRGEFQNSYHPKMIKGEHVVIDCATSLMWQTESSNQMKWRETKSFINILNQQKYAGFSDWRLPTLEELLSLLEFTQKEVFYIDELFDTKHFDLLCCWSSDKGSDGVIWTVMFKLGQIRYYPEKQPYSMLAVRSIGCFEILTYNCETENYHK